MSGGCGGGKSNHRSSSGGYTPKKFTGGAAKAFGGSTKTSGSQRSGGISGSYGSPKVNMSFGRRRS